MAMVNCKVEIGETTELTVGSRFALSCDGEWPELDATHLELHLGPEDQYKLRLLQFQKENSGTARLLVTSYRPGNHQLKALQLGDGKQAVQLSDLSFTVKSVLNPKEPESEPFGPLGPIKIGLPLWYFLFAASVFLLVGIFTWFRIRRKLQRKKLLGQMALEMSPMSPMAQLSQKIRGIIRELNQVVSADVVKNLDQSFRFYFARRFQIPTLHWKDKAILQTFKAEHPKLFKELGQDVREVFAELERALGSVDQLQHRDLEQLVQLVRHCSEKIEKELGARR